MDGGISRALLKCCIKIDVCSRTRRKTESGRNCDCKSSLRTLIQLNKMGSTYHFVTRVEWNPTLHLHSVRCVAKMITKSLYLLSCFDIIKMVCSTCIRRRHAPVIYQQLPAMINVDKRQWLWKLGHLGELLKTLIPFENKCECESVNSTLCHM